MSNQQAKIGRLPESMQKSETRFYNLLTNSVQDVKKIQQIDMLKE